MSIRIMSDVWRTKLPLTEKMVLLVISDHANDDGTEAWPSQATIAAKASISVRTVQRSVNVLVAKGYLWLQKGAGGSINCREDRRPHRYTIVLERVRADMVTTRKVRVDNDGSDGATMATATGRQSRPMNHPLDPPIDTPVEFANFWNTYPRKIAKGKALEAFIMAIKKAPVAVILEGARRYATDPYRDETYTAYPATWLNQERWSDDPLPPRDLTPAQKLAKEKAEAERRSNIEKQKSIAISREIQETAARAVAMPVDLRAKVFNLTRKLTP